MVLAARTVLRIADVYSVYTEFNKRKSERFVELDIHNLRFVEPDLRSRWFAEHCVNI